RGDPAVLHGRDRGGQVRDKLSLGIHAPQSVEEAHVHAPVHLDVGLERVEHRGLLREPHDHLSAFLRRGRRPSTSQGLRGHRGADTPQGRQQKLAPFHRYPPLSAYGYVAGNMNPASESYLGGLEKFPCLRGWMPASGPVRRALTGREDDRGTAPSTPRGSG